MADCENAIQGQVRGLGDWVLVPRVPTDAMLRAAQGAWLNDPLRRTTTMWAAMLAAAPQQPAAVDEAMVFRLAVWMAKHDGCEDPHRLIYEGSPPVPWGEVWNRYEYDARAALTAALAAQQQEPPHDRQD